MRDIVIFGAGGHAREVAQLIADINQSTPGCWQLRGFLADAHVPSVISKALPGPLLGDAQWLKDHPDMAVAVAVGQPQGRRQVVQKLLQAQIQLQFPVLVHPRAWVANVADLGQGTVVFAGALVQVDVSIGSFASVNLGCTLSHDVRLDDFVSLGPGVHLAGGSRVGQGSDLGAGVTFRPLAQVGQQCVVGAGAVVVKDLPDSCVATGIPAQPHPRPQVR